MRIDLRDENQHRIGRIQIDPAMRPTRVSLLGSGGGGREVFLNWDTSQDDAGQLRRCVACGCGDLFKEKVFPQLTGLVVIVAFAGAAVSALGMATPPILAAMVFVLALDIAILIVPRWRLVCYRCRTSYRGLSIARYHRRWDRALADRYAPPGGAAAEPSAGAAAAASSESAAPQPVPAAQPRPDRTSATSAWLIT